MKLAIHGGSPLRTKLFPAYKVIGEEEKKAVADVLESGNLSQFLGCWHPDFYGGPQVQALEKEWAARFGSKHAIAVNSATSGLFAAVGAAGIEPDDEIIVSPYTMAASATAPLIYGAVPIFADIEPEHFCLDPSSIEKKITSKTRAILVVDIFGLPYDADAIDAIAKKHGLIVIEDCAQAPGAKYKNRFAGTLGHMGVFSLNYHKHIHSGEGGIIVTDSDDLAEKLRLIRNHAEAVVGDKGISNLANMVGFNYRMTEIEAAIARCQLGKLDALLEQRQANCEYLAKELAKIPAIIPGPVRKGCTHSYYVQPFLFKSDIAGVSRSKFISAVKAELPQTEGRSDGEVLLDEGYVKPLYFQPMFQQKIAFGSKGWPFTSPWRKQAPDYSAGLCPVAERLHNEEFFSHELMRPPMTRQDLDDVVAAFFKVWENRSSLK